MHRFVSFTFATKCHSTHVMPLFLQLSCLTEYSFNTKYSRIRHSSSWLWVPAISTELQVNVWPRGRGLVRLSHQATAGGPAASLATLQSLWNRVILESDRLPAPEATAQCCLQQTAGTHRVKESHSTSSVTQRSVSREKEQPTFKWVSIWPLFSKSLSGYRSSTPGMRFSGIPTMLLSYKLASNSRQFQTISAHLLNKYFQDKELLPFYSRPWVVFLLECNLM